MNLQPPQPAPSHCQSTCSVCDFYGNSENNEEFLCITMRIICKYIWYLYVFIYVYNIYIWCIYVCVYIYTYTHMIFMSMFT